MSEKLQKVLARMGLGSRRGIEELISQGRVSVNGAAAKLGDRIGDDVTVAIDGKVVLRPGQQKPLCRVLMYHKPEGELTTLDDPEDRPTVFDHLPNPGSGRWIYIGRLDINTSGLLLFTTDGELANSLMHPSRGVERVYAARVFGEVSDEKIEQLTKGVKLEDGMAKFESVEFAGGTGMNSWYHCTLREGRKREVRRLWEACGLQVSRLIRIKYAGISLDPDLKAGQWRELSPSEVNILRKSAGLAPLDGSEIAPPLQPQVQGKGALGRMGKERPRRGGDESHYAQRRREGFGRTGRDGFDHDDRREGFGSRRAGQGFKSHGSWRDGERRYGASRGGDERSFSRIGEGAFGRRPSRDEEGRRPGSGFGRSTRHDGFGHSGYGRDSSRGDFRSDDRRGGFHSDGRRQGFSSEGRRHEGYREGGFDRSSRGEGFERRTGRRSFGDGGRSAPRRSFRRGG